jgi:hypothetical protein
MMDNVIQTGIYISYWIGFLFTVYVVAKLVTLAYFNARDQYRKEKEHGEA